MRFPSAFGRGLWPARIGVSVAAGIAVASFVVTRPLTAPLPATVEMADMTWPEVRTALDHGYTTVIVPSGGIEENGPHMVLAKHDFIVRYTAERIASRLGHALVAPVVSYVPQGDYDPPSGNMQYPGTIGVPPAVFVGVLEGIARSLKAAGFKTIGFIADHGESQAPQAEVARKLMQEWAGQGITVLAVGDYFADDAQVRYLAAQGETAAAIGHHAGIQDTSELMATHPQGVDLARLPSFGFTLAPTGFDGDPTHASAERGKALLELKIEAALHQIRAAIPSQ